MRNLTISRRSLDFDDVSLPLGSHVGRPKIFHPGRHWWMEDREPFAVAAEFALEPHYVPIVLLETPMMMCGSRGVATKGGRYFLWNTPTARASM